MKTKFKLFVAGILLTLSFLAPAPPVGAGPVDVFQNNPGCKGTSGTDICGTGGNGLFTVIQSIIQVLLIAGGIVAVIMIIIGGIRYITSNGEQSHVKGAKDTILYAVIGLVVTISAYAIVTWVVGKI